MKINCLFALLAVAHGATETTTTKDIISEGNDDIKNITKISRDAPPVAAYNQGSLGVRFPAVSRIRSKAKQNRAEGRRTQANVAVNGLNEELQKLASSMDHSNGRKGAFSKKAVGTGGTYSTYGSRGSLTGEPYLSGYNGIPETLDTSVGEPNYMGGLTKPVIRKHTFGSYGTADNDRGQIWLVRPTGSQPQQQVNAGYVNYGSKHAEYTNGFPGGYSEYTNADYSNHNTNQAPYNAGYQGGTDQDYTAINQPNYGSVDYSSSYGSQTSNRFSTISPQWNNQGYGQNEQGYGGIRDWQSSQNQQNHFSNWQQPEYGSSTDVNGQNNAGYNVFKVEQMPNNNIRYGNQLLTSDYVNRGYGYGMNDGSDIGYTNSGQQNYGSGVYSSYTTPMPIYESSNYRTSKYGGGQVSSNGQQTGYGDQFNQYGSGSAALPEGYNYQVTSYPSSYGSGQGYDNYGSQSGYEPTYAPQQIVTYGSNDNYQTGGYVPLATSDYSGYSNGYNTNNGYRSDYGQRLDYRPYVRPQVEFSMNVGYGSQKAAVKNNQPKLTNQLTPALAIEDGYKAMVI